MRVVFLMDHDDGHEKGKDYMVEPTLGRRLCENGVTIPYVTHLKNLEAEKETVAKAKKKAQKDKEAEKKAKAEKLLKKKEEGQKREKAVPKKIVKREKSIF